MTGPKHDRGELIQTLEILACTVPTDVPESDGTLEWSATTIVIVRAHAGGHVGLGYTYANVATAQLISEKIVGWVKGQSPWDVANVRLVLQEQMRNFGRPGIASMALSAVDVALWDLKARLLGLSLVSLLGAVRRQAPAYGSGGFTSYSDRQLREQIDGWVEQGFRRVKIKVGRRPEEDRRRVRLVRELIGPNVELFVDANGAYDRKQALALPEEIPRVRRGSSRSCPSIRRLAFGRARGWAGSG